MVDDGWIKKKKKIEEEEGIWRRRWMMDQGGCIMMDIY